MTRSVIELCSAVEIQRMSDGKGVLKKQPDMKGINPKDLQTIISETERQLVELEGETTTSAMDRFIRLSLVRQAAQSRLSEMELLGREATVVDGLPAIAQSQK